ncbi:MAG: septal ring lytic transglycosylase RlpA family protein [Nitrospiria bacterium]
MSKSSSLLLCLIASFLFLNACGASRPYRVGHREVGLASWYGDKFHGRPTASGEIYDMYAISAAHKTLPLGTLLRVTDLKSGRSIKVKVNDRGPFIGRRILDLSYGAAKKLGVVEAGVSKVKIEIIGRSPIQRRSQRAKNRFFVQVGSYEIRENALRMKQEVGRHYQKVYLKVALTSQGKRYRVRVGPYRTKKAAQTVAKGLQSRITGEKIRPAVFPGH